MILRSIVKRNAYFDSVTLMLAQREVKRAAGITEVGLVLATDANKSLLREAGILTSEASSAGPDDLVISVQGRSEEAVARALVLAEELLTAPRGTSAETGAYRPRTIAAAKRMMPDATVAAISVPGRFAGGVARDALKEGLHVFLFSDNVPTETEIGLKAFAAERGLIVMGPDCGTALIGGAGLGFANRVRRGSIGIVAAAGTGLQEVSTLIHRYGGGVSHAIGTGGRDLSESVGGVTMLRGLAALAADPDSVVIVLVAKPSDRLVAGRVLGAARRVRKPVVVAFVGSRVQADGNVRSAESLEDAARIAVGLAEGRPVEPRFADALPAQEAGRLSPQQRYLRGLFSGGTLCAEAQHILHSYLGRIYSNAPVHAEDVLPDALKSHDHTALDMGGGEFTQGRLHPMIDPALRLQRLQQESEDPTVGVILLDVVLGYGADRDPAASLAPAIAAARERAVKAGRYLSVVGSVCGTEEDVQDLQAQEDAFLEAGMIVQGSNARAARLAGLILQGKQGRVSAGQTGSRSGGETEITVVDAPLPDPGDAERLLRTPPAVINVGLELFAESLREQGVHVLDLDWQPPAGGKKHLLDLLDKLEA